MEELHAAIAEHLRRTRPAAAAGLRCVCCGASITGGLGLFHLEELREAASCALCHQARVMRAGRQPVYAPGANPHRARPVAPRCKHCGRPLIDGGAHPTPGQLWAARVCATCAPPFEE